MLRTEKDYPEAIASSEMAIVPNGRQTNDLRFLALVYGLAGRKSKTQKIITALKERSRHHYVFPTVFALAYIGLGDKIRHSRGWSKVTKNKTRCCFF